MRYTTWRGQKDILNKTVRYGVTRHTDTKAETMTQEIYSRTLFVVWIRFMGPLGPQLGSVTPGAHTGLRPTMSRNIQYGTIIFTYSCGRYYVLLKFHFNATKPRLTLNRFHEIVFNACKNPERFGFNCGDYPHRRYRLVVPANSSVGSRKTKQ